MKKRNGRGNNAEQQYDKGEGKEWENNVGKQHDKSKDKGPGNDAEYHHKNSEENGGDNDRGNHHEGGNENDNRGNGDLRLYCSYFTCAVALVFLGIKYIKR